MHFKEPMQNFSIISSILIDWREGGRVKKEEAEMNQLVKTIAIISSNSIEGVGREGGKEGKTIKDGGT